MSNRKAAYSISQFCCLYGLGRSTVYEEIGSDRLHAVKVGGRTLILIEAAEEWAKSLGRAVRKGGA